MQQRGGCDEQTGVSWHERGELRAAEAVAFLWFCFLQQLDRSDKQACERRYGAGLLMGWLLLPSREGEWAQTPWQSLSGEAKGAPGPSCRILGAEVTQKTPICPPKQDPSLLPPPQPLARWQGSNAWHKASEKAPARCPRQPPHTVTHPSASRTSPCCHRVEGRSCRSPAQPTVRIAGSQDWGGRKGLIKLQMEQLFFFFFYESLSHMSDAAIPRKHQADNSGTAISLLSWDAASHCNCAALLSSLAPGDIAQQRRTCLKRYTSPGTDI